MGEPRMDNILTLIRRKYACLMDVDPSVFGI